MNYLFFQFRGAFYDASVFQLGGGVFPFGGSVFPQGASVVPLDGGNPRGLFFAIDAPLFLAAQLICFL